MKEILLSILDYLLQVVTATAIQLLILLGPLLVLAFLMHLIASQIKRTGPLVFSDKGFVYGFKWLGTPIHEFGHAMFALLFGHRITQMKLFDPSARDGSYGYVFHSYKPGNIYQEIGNFFIGIGPILLGTIMLFLITYILFKFSITDLNQISITLESLTHISSLKIVGLGIINGVHYFFILVLKGGNSWWKILIFIYVLFSIGSSITLSPLDIKGALGGFFYFVAALFLFNLITSWIGGFTTDVLAKVSEYFSGFYFLMILSIVLNALFMLTLSIILLVINLIKRRREY